MNERILELAVQSDLLIKKTNGDEFRYGNFDPRFQKFAELIVRECINCTKEWRDAVRVGSDRDYSKGYVHGCDDSIVEMKMRFGVEEWTNELRN